MIIFDVASLNPDVRIIISLQIKDSMKKLFIFLICLALTTLSFSQEKTDPPRKGFIGFALGAGIPFGSFASTEVDNEYAAYAKAGFSLQAVNFGYLFHKYVGVSGLLRGGAFAYDVDAKERNIENTSASVSAETWSIGAALGGLLLSYPFNDWNVDFRAMIGYGYGTAPELRTAFIDGFYTQVIQTGSNSSAIAYDIGLGFRYNVHRLLCVNFMADYLICEPEFKSDILQDGVLIANSEFKQPMNNLMVSAGVGFRLK